MLWFYNRCVTRTSKQSKLCYGYDVETILDDVSDDELFASMIDESSDEAPPAPPATPQGGTENATEQEQPEAVPQQQDSTDKATVAAVLVVNGEGKVLCGVRSDNKLVCGPGGHIEKGEQPIQAAIREAQEEFGITPTTLILLATLGENNALQHKTEVFLCTSFTGTPKCDEEEMTLASFISLDELLENRDKMFKPFLASLLEYKKPAQTIQLSHIANSQNSGIIKSQEQNQVDGGPGSGNFGHGGVKGQQGGSTPSNAPTPTKFKTVNDVMDITSDLEVKASKSGKVRAFIREGGRITNISSFAGEGSSENLVMSGSLANSYKGTKPEEWSHKTGDSEVEIDGKTYLAEIHWFEHDEVGQVSFKLKKRKK